MSCGHVGRDYIWTQSRLNEPNYCSIFSERPEVIAFTTGVVNFRVCPTLWVMYSTRPLSPKLSHWLCLTNSYSLHRTSVLFDVLGEGDWEQSRYLAGQRNDDIHNSISQLSFLELRVPSCPQCLSPPTHLWTSSETISSRQHGLTMLAKSSPYAECSWFATSGVCFVSFPSRTSCTDTSLQSYV